MFTRLENVGKRFNNHFFRQPQISQKGGFLGLGIKAGAPTTLSIVYRENIPPAIQKINTWFFCLWKWPFFPKKDTQSFALEKMAPGPSKTIISQTIFQIWILNGNVLLSPFILYHTTKIIYKAEKLCLWKWPCIFSLMRGHKLWPQKTRHRTYIIHFVKYLYELNTIWKPPTPPLMHMVPNNIIKYNL